MLQSHLVHQKALGHIYNASEMDIFIIYPLMQSNGIDTAIHRTVGDGSAPPMLCSHESNSTFRSMTLERVTEMLFESELEQPLR